MDLIVDLLADELSDVNIKYQKPKITTIPALLKSAQDIQGQPGDEIWIVLDRDEGNRKDEKQWKDLARWEKESSNHHVAISNPRFEYWLLFHFEEAPKKEDAKSDFYFVKKGYFLKYDRKKRVPSNKEKINLNTLNLAIKRRPPYCTSERGSNENANRFIRRFFPKGTDLSGVSQKTLNAIALWMNRYPRAIFNGKSAWHMAQPFRHYFTPLFS